jgi:hypothetical protein
MAISTRRDLRLAVARRGDAAVHAHSITSIRAHVVTVVHAHSSTSLRAHVDTASLAADAAAVREEAAPRSGA